MALEPNRSYAATAGARVGAEVDEGLRSYMLRVYNYMALGVAGTGVVTLFMAANPAIMQAIALGPMKWVVFLGVLGMGFMSPKIITMKSTVAAQAFYWVYCALWGVMISPMIYFFLQSPGGVMDIARAFFITAGMFAGMSALGYVTKKDLSGLGRFFMMAIIGILIAMLINVFFVESTGFSLILSIGVVLLFAALTAYETQMIKNMYAEHYGQDAVAKMAIFGALMLYGSFVTMFIHILNILAIMRGE
eukprot:g13687.t1